MDPKSATQITTSDGRQSPPLRLRDLVMAWAVDCDTGQPRYILQLDAAHRGAKSNCKCPSCDSPLQAINAAKTEFQMRPHFRHPAGAARNLCVIIAARKALQAMFGEQEVIELPRRRRSGRLEGLSGKFFDVWVEQPAELVRLKHCELRDEATAILTLDDGRRLAVKLVGSGDQVKLDGEDALLATIELQVDDPAIAMMSPEEIFSRLKLAWGDGCWRRHWGDADLDRQADAKARAVAVAELDWLDDPDLPAELTPVQRRETLLHREVKAILEREKRICLPGVSVTAKWRRKDGSVDTKSYTGPDVEVELTSVSLETHLGFAVPDVIIEWKDDGWIRTVVIEVTVTNPLTEDRIEKLSSLDWPVLEIDIGRMGGLVTREELTRLVVDEIAGKRWRFNSAEDAEHERLVQLMKLDEVKAIEARNRRTVLQSTPPPEWARRFLEAFCARWQEDLKGATDDRGDGCVQATQAIKDAIDGLEVHGYLTAPEMEHSLLRNIIARILSIKLGTGVEYKCDNVWPVINAIHCDGDRAKKWHTLYLIALRVYKPALSADHQDKTSQWRDQVTASIEHGEETYMRETRFDRLLSLLFPELREALKKSFGTIRIVTPDSGPPVVNLNDTARSATDHHDLYLRGRAFEEWKRTNPAAAMAWLNSPAGKGFGRK